MLLRLRTNSYKKIPTATAIAKMLNAIIAFSASRTVNSEYLGCSLSRLFFKTICWLSHVTLLSPIEWEADTSPSGDARYVCQRDRYSIALFMLFVNYYCLNRGGRGGNCLKQDLLDYRIYRSGRREDWMDRRENSPSSESRRARRTRRTRKFRRAWCLSSEAGFTGYEQDFQESRPGGRSYKKRRGYNPRQRRWGFRFYSMKLFQQRWGWFSVM